MAAVTQRWRRAKAQTRVIAGTFDPATSPFGLGLLVGGTAIIGGLVLALGGPIAAAAVLLAIILAAVVMRDMEIGFWGVIGVVCLLPFATIPVDIGLTPTLLDMALAATIGVWALNVVTGRQRTIIVAPVTLPLVIFILAAIFAFIFGLANGPLTPNLLRHFAELLLSIGFVLVVVDFCADWRRLERLIQVLLLAGGGGAAIGVVLWLLPDGTANDLLNLLSRIGYPGGLVIRYIEDNPELSERAIGTAVDPNAFGGLLLLIGALAAPQLMARRPLFRRGLVAAVTGSVFLALVLTFSRSAMLGLAAGLGFVALARYRRLFAYLAVLGLILLLLPISQGYVVRFVEGLQGQDLATQMRFGEYRDALTLIGRYPLFGVGFAGSPDIDLYLGVASIYLTIGQEMGFFGLAAFLAVIGSVFGYGFFKRAYFRGHPRHDAIWLGLHAALVGALVTGILDHYMISLDFHHAVTAFWLFIGLAIAATRLADQAMESGLNGPGDANLAKEH